MQQATKPKPDELTNLVEMLRPQTRWCLTWKSYCAAAYLLRTYAAGTDNSATRVLGAIVRIESTIEALQDQRLRPVERVALEYGSRLAQLAWRRHELEAELRSFLTQSDAAACNGA